MLKTLNRPVKDHKCAIFIFIFIFLYNFFIVNNFAFCKIDDITYAYHLVDYSLGFCTKLLPGAIYNAIFSTTDPAVVNIYFNCLYHVFLVAVAFVLEKFVNNFQDEKKVFAFVVVLFFITGPATFAIHTKELGMLDTYWLFFFLLLLLFLKNKFLKWFIPAIFILCILVHISSIVSFLPFFLLLILYEATINKTASKSYYIILVLSIIVTAISFMYFLVFEESNLTLTLDEFYAFLDERNASGTDVFDTYYEYALYKVDFTQEAGTKFSDNILIEGSGTLVNLINSIWSQIKITLYTYSGVSEYILVFVQEVFLTTPILVYMYRYLSQKAAEEKYTKFQGYMFKLPVIAFPLLFLMSTFFSPDLTRWYGNTFICLSVFVMYVMYDTKDIDVFDKTDKFAFLRTTTYFMFHSLNIVNPYY